MGDDVTSGAACGALVAHWARVDQGLISAGMPTVLNLLARAGFAQSSAAHQVTEHCGGESRRHVPKPESPCPSGHCVCGRQAAIDVWLNTHRQLNDVYTVAYPPSTARASSSVGMRAQIAGVLLAGDNTRNTVMRTRLDGFLAPQSVCLSRWRILPSPLRAGPPRAAEDHCLQRDIPCPRYSVVPISQPRQAPRWCCKWLFSRAAGVGQLTCLWSQVQGARKPRRPVCFRCFSESFSLPRPRRNLQAACSRNSTCQHCVMVNATPLIHHLRRSRWHAIECIKPRIIFPIEPYL